MNDQDTAQAGSMRRPAIVLLLVALLVGGAVGYLLAPGDADGKANAAIHPRFINPSAETRVGEKIRFKLSDGRLEEWEIVASDLSAPSYEVNFSSWREGGDTPEPMRRKMERSSLGAPNPYWNIRSIQFDPVVVAGKRWNSWRVEMTDPTIGAEYTIWMTDELPVMGWVKREYTAKDKLYTMELDRYWFAGQ